MSDDSEAWRGESPFARLYAGPTPEQIAAYKERVARLRAEGEMHRLTLGRFSVTVQCPKCHHHKARTGFCAGSEAAECFRHASDREHLHRNCRRCGYTWYELPLDATENQPT